MSKLDSAWLVESIISKEGGGYEVRSDPELIVEEAFLPSRIECVCVRTCGS
jgi:hypothetical protein